MSNTFDTDQLLGGTVYDSSGDKVGKVGQVYLDDRTEEPNWVTVNTGLFGTSECFVPLWGAQTSGTRINVPYTKDFIKGAPSVDEDGHLDESEEQQLYDYYNKDQAFAGRVDDATMTTILPPAGRGPVENSGAPGDQNGRVAQGRDQQPGGEQLADQRDDEQLGDQRSERRNGAEYVGATGPSDYVGEEYGRYGQVDSDLPDPSASGVAVDRVDESAESAPHQEQTELGEVDEREALPADAGEAEHRDVALDSGDAVDNQPAFAATDPAAQPAASLSDDGSVIRREEVVRVGTERVETGRVRVRKYVVTEQQTLSVAVQREEVEVVREPIADAEATRGGTLGDAETVVTLFEDRPVVQKEVVDKERIVLGKRLITDQAQVTTDVSREEVEIDTGYDGDTRR